jgi:hypothetical protein
MALVTKSFSDIITFTRASTATYFNSAGVLTSAAINVPRFDYNPSTLTARGLLIEESRANLLLQSADLYETGTGAVNWIYSIGAVAANTQIAPDGTLSADTLTTTGGGAQSIYQSATVSASTSYTFSVYVRLGTMLVSDYKIAVYNNSTPGFIASDIVPLQTPTTSGWTRITYTFTTPVGCTSVRVYPFRNGIGLSSCTVFLWGAQLEAGAFPTSYIPTTTTALTRSADVAQVNTLSPWYNASEGTIYSEGSVASFAATPAITSFSDGTDTGNLIQTNTSSLGVVRLRVTIGGVAQVNNISSGVTATANTTFKSASTYKASDFAISVNAAAAATQASGSVPTPTQLRFMQTGSGGSIFTGYLRRITYYPRRLSNAELVSITS